MNHVIMQLIGELWTAPILVLYLPPSGCCPGYSFQMASKARTSAAHNSRILKQNNKQKQLMKYTHTGMKSLEGLAKRDGGSVGTYAQQRSRLAVRACCELSTCWQFQIR